MAAVMVPIFMISALTISLPMVAATAVPEKAPIIFRIVARIIAFLGERTRVAIMVAIAFGASVQPFTNSAHNIKKRARRRISNDISI